MEEQYPPLLLDTLGIEEDDQQAIIPHQITTDVLTQHDDQEYSVIFNTPILFFLLFFSISFITVIGLYFSKANRRASARIYFTSQIISTYKIIKIICKICCCFFCIRKPSKLSSVKIKVDGDYLNDGNDDEENGVIRLIDLSKLDPSKQVVLPLLSLQKPPMHSNASLKAKHPVSYDTYIQSIQATLNIYISNYFTTLKTQYTRSATAETPRESQIDADSAIKQKSYIPLHLKSGAFSPFSVLFTMVNLVCLVTANTKTMEEVLVSFHCVKHEGKYRPGLYLNFIGMLMDRIDTSEENDEDDEEGTTIYKRRPYSNLVDEICFMVADLPSNNNNTPANDQDEFIIPMYFPDSHRIDTTALFTLQKENHKIHSKLALDQETLQHDLFEFLGRTPTQTGIAIDYYPQRQLAKAKVIVLPTSKTKFIAKIGRQRENDGSGGIVAVGRTPLDGCHDFKFETQKSGKDPLHYNRVGEFKCRYRLIPPPGHARIFDGYFDAQTDRITVSSNPTNNTIRCFEIPINYKIKNTLAQLIKRVADNEEIDHQNTDYSEILFNDIERLSLCIIMPNGKGFFDVSGSQVAKLFTNWKHVVYGGKIGGQSNYDLQAVPIINSPLIMLPDVIVNNSVTDISSTCAAGLMSKLLSNDCKDLSRMRKRDTMESPSSNNTTTSALDTQCNVERILQTTTVNFGSDSFDSKDEVDTFSRRYFDQDIDLSEQNKTQSNRNNNGGGNDEDIVTNAKKLIYQDNKQSEPIYLVNRAFYWAIMYRVYKQENLVDRMAPSTQNLPNCTTTNPTLPTPTNPNIPWELQGDYIPIHVGYLTEPMPAL